MPRRYQVLDLRIMVHQEGAYIYGIQKGGALMLAGQEEVQVQDETQPCIKGEVG